MTNAELAVLSLVVEKPRHGYEIEQVIEERGMREWTEIGFSSIYYLLKKLEQGGFVFSQLVESARGPARRVYQATAAGMEAHRGAVLDALTVPRRSYPTLLLALASLPLMVPSQARSALLEYRGALAARYAHVQSNWHRQKPLPDHIDAMFDYTLTMIQSETAWVDAYIRKLEEHDDQD